VLAQTVLNQEERSIHGDTPYLVGWVTSFGTKKWAFRVNEGEGFSTKTTPTETFESRQAAVDTAMETLRVYTAPQDTIKVDMFDMMPTRGQQKRARRSQPKRPFNNKARTPGRQFKYIDAARDSSGRVTRTKRVSQAQ
jgi:hypothetical protein